MRIILFIVLKLLEVSAVVLVPYCIGNLMLDGDGGKFLRWIAGLCATLIVSMMLILVGFLVATFGRVILQGFIDFNWKMVDTILNTRV